MKVLIVEDDPGIADVLDYSLRGAGFDVLATSSGREAVRMSESSDFVVLDIGLPDRDGFDVCRDIRKSSTVPILFLTSRSDEIDRVVGLELGADDYLAKPFSPRELVARIKAIARRSIGHTHGGQCVLPFVGAPIRPSHYGQKYASGLCRGPVAKVFVTTGVGHSFPPIRINCPAEVALLTLSSNAGAFCHG